MTNNNKEFVEMKTMSVRVYPDQRAFIDAFAYEHRMTLSAVVRKALNDLIDKEKTQAQFIEELRDA